AVRSAEALIAKFRSVRQGLLLDSCASVVSAAPANGWERMPLGEVVPSVEYGISESLDRDPRGTPVLRMNNLQGGKVDLEDLRYYSGAVPRRVLLQRGDVLFNRTNSIDHVGKAGIWQGQFPDATFASYLVRLNINIDRIIPEYLVEWLMHPVIRRRLRAISTVAVQQVNVNPTRLRDLEIDMPADLSEQRKITAALSACDDEINREASRYAKLRTVRQGLMRDLISGR
ncbi:restriction endonuclease subunit S, partial [Streptomyces sp. NPDC059956]